MRRKQISGDREGGSRLKTHSCLQDCRIILVFLQKFLRVPCSAQSGVLHEMVVGLDLLAWCAIRSWRYDKIR